MVWGAKDGFDGDLVSGWTRYRVLFSFQEGITYSRWSARLDGGDRRQLIADGWPIEVR